MPNNRKFLKLSQRIKRKLLSGEQQPKAELPYFLKLPKSNCGQRSIKFYFHRYFMVLNHSWNNSWNSEKMCLRLGQGSSRFVVLCLKLNFHNCVTSSLPLLLPLYCSRVYVPRDWKNVSSTHRKGHSAQSVCLKWRQCIHRWLKVDDYEFSIFGSNRMAGDWFSCEILTDLIQTPTRNWIVLFHHAMALLQKRMERVSIRF